MIADDALALRNAVRNRLQSDVGLTARLGSAFVFDEAPDTAQNPYITFGMVRSRDWSTASEAGSEHFLVIEVWSAHHGTSECLDITALVAAALDDPPIPLSGRTVVLLRQISLETVRRDRGRLIAARLTMRALIDDA